MSGFHIASLTQLGECLPYKQEVVGSNPTGCTKLVNHIMELDQKCHTSNALVTQSGQSARLRSEWSEVRILPGVLTIKDTNYESIK